MRYNNICSDFAELCKGSTADSDSVCLGSNPSSAAKKSLRRMSEGFLHIN